MLWQLWYRMQHYYLKFDYFGFIFSLKSTLVLFSKMPYTIYRRHNILYLQKIFGLYVVLNRILHNIVFGNILSILYLFVTLNISLFRIFTTDDYTFYFWILYWVNRWLDKKVSEFICTQLRETELLFLLTVQR